MLVALTSAEAESKPAAVANANSEAEKKHDKNVEGTEDGETAKNKRGLHASLGDYASFGHESYGGQHDFGHGGHDFGGFQGSFQGYHGGYEGHEYAPSEHHHEHVKHVTVEKKIPV